MTVFNVFADPIKPGRYIIQTVYFVALDRREFHIFAPETLQKLELEAVEGLEEFITSLKKAGRTKKQKQSEGK